MQTVVIWAHPGRDSFSHALFRTTTDALRRAGHHVDTIDLYGEDYRTAMTEAEWLDYGSEACPPPADVARHIALARDAEQLVFVYPTWWFGLPAVLKGWLERTMLPGVAFRLDERNRMRGNLTELRRVIGISTYGSPAWYVHGIGDAGRRTIVRGLQLNSPTPLRVRSRWFALYDMDRIGDTERRAFLSRVDEQLGTPARGAGALLDRIAGREHVRRSPRAAPPSAGAPVAPPASGAAPATATPHLPDGPDVADGPDTDGPDVPTIPIGTVEAPDRAGAAPRDDATAPEPAPDPPPGPARPGARRALVVYAHPGTASYAAAVRDRAVSVLRGAGHHVDVIDLWADDFDPRLGAGEVRDHRAGLAARPTLADHAARLRAADALVLIYPTWWGGQPAMLKGWFDRVWCEGVAYTLPAGANHVRPLLRNVRDLVVVTTYGAPRRINALQREPGRRTVRWGLRTLLHRRVRTRWLALYGMDRNGPEERALFLDQVARRLARLGS